MKRGLIIGKFLPVHKGHIALIDFAATQCDELIVSMSYTHSDQIGGEIRFQWLRNILKNRKGVKPEIVLDNFDDETLNWDERTKKWAEFIKNRFPPVHVLFSSEAYGEPFARNLGVLHVQFDKERKNSPVSASLIRSDPFRYWDFIPSVVKPHFVKKICFYGPESTGKSFMAKKMAEKFHTEFVPEVARELLTSNDFKREDIIMIGRAQTERIFEKARKANKILFCDTDLITTQIYSRQYLKVVPTVLYELEKMIKYELYFLFDIDVPWVSDGLRDLGDEKKREEMFTVFKNELERRNIPYINVSGDWEERERIIEKAITKLLNTRS